MGGLLNDRFKDCDLFFFAFFLLIDGDRLGWIYGRGSRIGELGMDGYDGYGGIIVGLVRHILRGGGIQQGELNRDSESLHFHDAVFWNTAILMIASV